MAQLNAIQVSLLNEIVAQDPEFCATIQRRLQAEVEAAIERANKLKEAVSFEAPATIAPAKRGRPRGSSNSDGKNKMEAVRDVLRAHPGLQLQDISDYLEGAGVAIENSMLSSYLYHLVRNEEVSKRGKRNSYTYTLRGAKRK